MALTMQNGEFTHILRILGTNVDGKRTLPYALTSISGIGRRMAFTICKKLNLNPKMRAGELEKEFIEKLGDHLAKAQELGVPTWMMNRINDPRDGSTGHVVANQWDSKLRDDAERLKKIRNHRGFRKYYGLRVRGQHTKTTGRRGKTVGVSKKK